MTQDAWNYPSAVGHTTGTALAGFKVEALDGGIGKVDQHTEDVDAACLVVDTGPWIFGKEVLIPAGAVTRVDTTEEKVHIALTKDQIKGAPAFHRQNHLTDTGYRDTLSAYYWPRA
ncbi:PRC-barrel domain containing protein [Streptomyces sp. NPDC057638]|uniref:PRC-barrel domain containing protein n=1 Tax=Streptomyces sp. NPDC057638 TaxID=3346190 RepID=UPI0036832FE8